MSAGLVDLGDVKSYEEATTTVNALLVQAQNEGGNRVVLQSRSESLKNKIMLAEDDRLMANIIIHNLKKAGFEVDYFSDGALALEGAEAQDYSLMITDIKMPVIDGFELLRRVRMLPGKTHTPVLILTSMGNEDDIVRAFDSGADDYLLKPFSPKELIARINRMLRGLS
jgi:DNA-binding response OmpR family regulator